MRMTFLLVFLTRVLVGQLLAVPGSLELPTWSGLSEAEREVSGILWIPDIAASGRGGELQAEQSLVDAPLYGRAPEEVGAIASLPNADADVAEEGAAVGAQVLAEYTRGLSPGRPLLDPQHLLSEPAMVDLLSFLAFHERESKVPIRVVLFASTDDPTGVLDLQAVCDSWFDPEQASGCMLAYFLGRPDRSRLYFPTWSPDLGSMLKSAGALVRCVRSAEVVENDISQLDRFGVELSMQIFRAQKILQARTGDQFSERRAITILGPEQVATSRTGGAWFFLAGLLLLGILGVLVVVRRRKNGVMAPELGVYVLDEFKGTRRLGGPYSGGAGGVVFFGRDRPG